MAYSKEAYTNDELRQKMRKWGIVKEDTTPVIRIADILSYADLDRFYRVKPFDVSSEIKDLKSRVRELERRVGGRREITKADIVYENFRKELEETQFGKIVAIDTEKGEIVGKGATILEAYKEAKERTGKDQFDFKRVGYKYLYKV